MTASVHSLDVKDAASQLLICQAYNSYLDMVTKYEFSTIKSFVMMMMMITNILVNCFGTGEDSIH